MKKFTKLFLSCAAVAALTAAVATSAMAVDLEGEVAGTYENGVLTLTGSEVSDTGNSTILVFGPNATAVAVDGSDILFIDQVDDGDFGDMGVKGGALAEPEDHQDTYQVWVGTTVDGTFKVLKSTFKLGTASGEPGVMGDVDPFEGIDANDATYVLYYAANERDADLVGKSGVTATLSDGSSRLLADVDPFEGVDANDATYILYYAANERDTDLVGITGEAVTVEAE